LATGHLDGSARVWALDSGEWTFREVACFGGMRRCICSRAVKHC
jgi:hypothetical protein